MTLSISEGKTLTPRMISISSVRPLIRPMRRWVRPQRHGSALRLLMSPVR
jgi:hypothetical protein